MTEELRSIQGILTELQNQTDLLEFAQPYKESEEREMLQQLPTQQRITLAGNGDDRSRTFAHLFIESDSAKIHFIVHSRNRGSDCDTFVVTDQGMKELFFVEERSGKAVVRPSLFVKFHIKESAEFVLVEGQKLPMIGWTKVRIIRPKERSGNQPWYHMIFSAGEQRDMVVDLSY